MEEIKTIAQSQQNQMTKEEIHRYLSDMELQEDQFDAVYQYLAMNGITISGYHPSTLFPSVLSPDDDTASKNQETKHRISKADRNLARSLPHSGTVSLPVMLPPKKLWSTNSSIRYSRLRNPTRNEGLL